MKEVNAKIRTLEYELEKGLTRTVAENHDTLLWLVQHAAATVIKHRTGVDGRTPFHRRRSKSFQRVVASLERQAKTRARLAQRVVGAKAFAWDPFGAGQGAP